MKRLAARIASGETGKKTVLHRLIIGALGFGLLASGSMLVHANDGPDVYGTVMQYAPSRRAAPPPVVVHQPVVLQRFEAPLPKVFRLRETPPPRALGFAPVPQSRIDSRLAPLNRPEASAPLVRDYPHDSARSLESYPGQARPRHKAVRREARRKLYDSSTHVGAGLASATHYCVRTCDGFAFPIGDASGNAGVQEAACRSACPGAETLLYSSPAGAKDFDAMSRGGSSYSALPNAFRYREKLDNACRCNTPGYATNPSAVVSDLTLRQGDLVMSRVGMRYFEGSRSLPYRARNFSDAISRLESKREVMVVRAMEVASMRGILSPKAPNYVRERLVAQVRVVEIEARREAAAHQPQRNLGRGFQELRAREARGATTLKTVQRKVGIVALN